jgi:polyhydroxybutyrate depolymerase
LNRFAVCVPTIVTALALLAGAPALADILENKATRSQVPGWHEGNIAHDRRIRYFNYYLPRDLPKNAPAVVLLHGGTQSMRKIFGRHAGATREWLDIAEEEHFLLLVPNGTNPETGDTRGDKQNWNDCRKPGPGVTAISTADDVGFIASLIDWAGSKFNIDKTRVYVTGASNGGLMAYRLAVELGDRVAAIAAFVANLPADNQCRSASRPVPVMIVNGTEDPLMPWAGGTIPGRRGRVLSAEETLNYWLQVNRSDTENVEMSQISDRNPHDRSRVTRVRYRPLPGGADVLFYKIDGGGHTVPSIEHAVPAWARRLLVGTQNRDVEGAREAFSFLRQHLRERGGSAR